MTTKSICPDYSALEIAMDSWSEPFWQAGGEGRVVMQQCRHCDTFRWPAGPFCPQCHQQEAEWAPVGQARLYSFTVVPVPSANKDTPPACRIPALAEFDDAPGVRLVSVLIDADPHGVTIGAPLEIEWRPAANGMAPVFRLPNS